MKALSLGPLARLPRGLNLAAACASFQPTGSSRRPRHYPSPSSHVDAGLVWGSLLLPIRGKFTCAKKGIHFFNSSFLLADKDFQAERRRPQASPACSAGH